MQGLEQYQNSGTQTCDINDNHLDSVFEATRNVPRTNPIYLFPIHLKESGLAAADTKELSDIAYAASFSSKIYVLSRKVDDSFDEDCLKRINEEDRGTPLDGKFVELDCLQHACDVTALSYTNGPLLLSGCLDGTLKAWSRNYQFVQSYCAFTKSVSDIHASPRMDYFVASSLTGLKGIKGNKTFGAAMFSFSDTKPIMSFLGHTARVQSVRIHSNGKYIATASEDNSIKMWDTQTSKCVRTFQDKKELSPHLMKIAFSPDGKYLASTYYGSVKIWDLASGRLIIRIGQSYSAFPVYNICYCKFGHKLAAGGSDGIFKIWNMKDFSPESSSPNGDIGLLVHKEIHKSIFNITCTNSNIFSALCAEL